ncbi:MAG: hypothetical protein ACI888_000361 [Flavobacteriales bacterium]|jgi:hypothetical protein
MFSAFILAVVRAFLIAESLVFSSLVFLKEGLFRLATSNANKPSIILSSLVKPVTQTLMF